MSNINQNNFNNCMNLRLSNSDYWDLFICNDCGCGLDHEEILDVCVIIDIDIDNNKCISGDSICSLISWTGDTCFEKLSIPATGLTLNDIGLTGIDNGFITYDCSASTTGSTFIQTYTGSTLYIPSADTKFCFTRVTGCTYDYPYEYVSSANTVGRYLKLCGGFFQGFFKLSDRTFFKDISNNMFVWPLSWFNCPPVCHPPLTGSTKCCIDPRKAYECYKEQEPVPWNYQILPTRYEQGWTAEFWMRKTDVGCTGNTGNTLNALYPDNEGFFYYMGTRAENKFWDVFSGETGYTTSSGYPLPPPKTTKQVLLNNPFLVYQPVGCCCFSGVTTVTTHERDRNEDIVNNALGFRIKNDGSIGYRSLGVSGKCESVTATTVVDCSKQCGCCCTGTTTAVTVSEKYITGVTVNEEYSEKDLIPNNEWMQIAIRFCAYEAYPEYEIKNVPRRKGRLDFFVNGYLKYSIEEFDEFLFKDLIEYREKQEGVPFNYSLGGGTQGLLETNTIGGPDPLDENLIMQEFFAGTFIGDISKFRLYECCLDITTIRYRFNEFCVNYGICPLPIDCFLESESGNLLSSEDGDDLLIWCNE